MGELGMGEVASPEEKQKYLKPIIAKELLSKVKALQSGNPYMVADARDAILAIRDDWLKLRDEK